MQSFTECILPCNLILNTQNIGSLLNVGVDKLEILRQSLRMTLTLSYRKINCHSEQTARNLTPTFIIEPKNIKSVKPSWILRFFH